MSHLVFVHYVSKVHLNRGPRTYKLLKTVNKVVYELLFVPKEFLGTKVVINIHKGKIVTPVHPGFTRSTRLIPVLLRENSTFYTVPCRCPTYYFCNGLKGLRKEEHRFKIRLRMDPSLVQSKTNHQQLSFKSFPYLKSEISDLKPSNRTYYI